MALPPDDVTILFKNKALHDFITETSKAYDPPMTPHTESLVHECTKADDSVKNTADKLSEMIRELNEGIIRDRVATRPSRSDGSHPTSTLPFTIKEMPIPTIPRATERRPATSEEDSSEQPTGYGSW